MLSDPKLSNRASELFVDPTNLCLISPVNHWEMAIKISVGKYRINDDFEMLWKDALSRFTILPIEPRHSAQLLSMPLYHKDPFDRMLIAQVLA